MIQHKPKKQHFRYSLYSSIIAFYLLPILALSIYCSDAANPGMKWIVTITGFLMGTVGSLILVLIIRRCEMSIRYRMNAFLELKIQKVLEQNTSFSTTIVSQYDPENNSYNSYTPSPSPIETILTPSPYTPHHVNAVKAVNKSESNIKQLRLQENLEENQRKIGLLSHEIESKNKELRQASHEIDKLEQQRCSLQEELLNTKKENSQKVKQKESILGEYQQTIVEQRGIIEKKQKYIGKLETKVRDLSYEVKALLQLSDIHPPTHGREHNFEEDTENQKHPLINAFETSDLEPYPHSSNIIPLSSNVNVSSDREVQTPYDAALQLQKCITIAQKLRGIPNLSGETPRFVDISLDNYTIDMRRLFDRFRDETSCAILVYSLSEKKILFVNNQIKNFLGWTPEKVVKDFNSLLQKGRGEWNEVLAQLPHIEEGQVRILLRAKDCHDILLHCHLAMIPSEVFNNHAIGILYPI